MNTIDWLEKYLFLMTQFVTGDITASQFEASYLEVFKNENIQMPEHVYDVLNSLFLDVDAYCSDPELRDDEDLDEEELMNSAKRALKKLSQCYKESRDFVDLTAHRKQHILNRHRAGAGKPGKTEFPANWSDDQILHHVSDIATDPKSSRGVGKWDSPYAIGTRDGIEIRVDFYPNNHQKYAGKISTAYPTNVSPNP